ncbi:hypothetical protein NQ314_014147 [Rhamnusium bicolor]|uniref:Uncharacterized protein n=1 Tax=Rhamnusium bicolor TaxID=1586634 RepID=A0AAV8X4A0_9CUCU|nr:hypothetical protein NQ314_014147 [Rhamnusium bicolor]
MQNINEDTEWNDILREKGIIPQKEKRDYRRSNCYNARGDHRKENKCIAGGKKLSELDLEELDELEDSEDEAILLEYRKNG